MLPSLETSNSSAFALFVPDGPGRGLAGIERGYNLSLPLNSTVGDLKAGLFSQCGRDLPSGVINPDFRDVPVGLARQDDIKPARDGIPQARSG
jgi:hypothetical protein